VGCGRRIVGLEKGASILESRGEPASQGVEKEASGSGCENSSGENPVCQCWNRESVGQESKDGAMG